MFAGMAIELACYKGSIERANLMKRIFWAVWLVFLVISCSNEGLCARTAKNEGRIGDLLVTVNNVRLTPASGGRSAGFHAVTFEVVLKNVGKEALCPTLRARLEESYGLEDSGTFKFRDSQLTHSDMGLFVLISRMLPGDELQGDLAFDKIRDGVDPIKLWIELSRASGGNLGCSDARPMRPISTEIKILVRDVPRVQGGD